MACTIHLRGKLTSPKQAAALIDEVSSIASILDWDFNVVDDEHLRGISLFPDQRCDALHLLFDREGVLRYPTTSPDDTNDRVTMCTHGAPDDVMIGVATLLKQLDQHHFAELAIETENAEWDRSNLQEVEERCERADRKMSRSIAELESIEQLFSVVPYQDVDMAAARVFWREQDRAATPEERGSPPGREVLETWALEDWVDYFNRRDCRLYPALGHMREAPETLDGCATAISRGREDEERSTEESPALFIDEQLPPTDETEVSAGGEEPMHSAPTRSRGNVQGGELSVECFENVSKDCGTLIEAITVMGEVAIRRQFEWSPVLEYVTYSTMASIIGVYMAWRYWRREENFPRALAARYTLASRRYRQVQKLLEAAGHQQWAGRSGVAASGCERAVSKA